MKSEEVGFVFFNWLSIYMLSLFFVWWGNCIFCVRVLDPQLTDIDMLLFLFIFIFTVDANKFTEYCLFLLDFQA